MDISIFQPFTQLPFTTSSTFLALLGIPMGLALFGFILFTGLFFDGYSLRLRQRLLPASGAILSVIIFVLGIVIVNMGVNGVSTRQAEVRHNLQVAAQQVYGVKLSGQQAKALLNEDNLDMADYPAAKNDTEFGSTTLLVDGQPSRITLYRLHDELVLYSFGQPHELPRTS